MRFPTQKTRATSEAVRTNPTPGTANFLTQGNVVGSSARTPQEGDIEIVYHPHSEKDTLILSPEEFKEGLNPRSEPAGPLDGEPWRPFSSRVDFDFAELVHNAKLNRKQIEGLIKIIQQCKDEPGLFTFNGYNDLKKVLDSTEKLLTKVSIFL
jgi:hypothetical protein